MSRLKASDVLFELFENDDAGVISDDENFDNTETDYNIDDDEDCDEDDNDVANGLKKTNFLFSNDDDEHSFHLTYLNETIP